MHIKSLILLATLNKFKDLGNGIESSLAMDSQLDSKKVEDTSEIIDIGLIKRMIHCDFNSIHIDVANLILQCQSKVGHSIFN